jgi:hypothetical protein
MNPERTKNVVMRLTILSPHGKMTPRGEGIWAFVASSKK